MKKFINKKVLKKKFFRLFGQKMKIRLTSFLVSSKLLYSINLNSLMVSRKSFGLIFSQISNLFLFSIFFSFLKKKRLKKIGGKYLKGISVRKKNKNTKFS